MTYNYNPFPFDIAVQENNISQTTDPSYTMYQYAFQTGTFQTGYSDSFTIWIFG